MIKLYAIEPEAILNPRVQQALEAFEFCQGRIVGCVPKGWKKRVYEIFDEQPHGKEREALKKTLEILFRKRAVKKIRLPIAKGDHWLAQAASIDEQELNGILVTTVPELGDEVSDSRIFDCWQLNDDNPIWKQETGIREFRDPKAMAEKVRILLRYASEVKFIDPHFKGEKKHTDFVVECIKSLNTWRNNKQPPLELHFHFPSEPTDDPETRKARSLPVFRTVLLKTQVALSKQKAEVSLYQWSIVDAGDRFHERTVVTDCGSIEFGGGLDSGKQNEKTSVKLMSSSVHEELRNAYRYGSGVYELLHHEKIA